MRSAETSGVETRRFDLQQGSPFGSQKRLPFPLPELPPATLAIAATALAAALLYCLFELTPLVAADFGLKAGCYFVVALVAIGVSLHRRPMPETDATDELLGTLPFGVACWTREARLTGWNERFVAKLRGAGKPLLRGASYGDVLKTMTQGGTIQLVREDTQNRLLEVQREDGSTLLIEERPLGGHGFVTMVMDVTESRRTSLLLSTVREEQRQLARRYHDEKIRAEAASRSKTSFLAHLSHDIRTPLNHIIGFADMIRQQPFGPLGDAKYLNYVDAVKTSGEKLLTFFASILELAEFEGGRRALKREHFTADALLVTTLRRFSTQAQRAGVTLGLGSACDAMLKADRFALERMLNNIVENAIRFTPRGGKVTLAGYAATDGVLIEVTDTGVGIAPERLEMLSQPFAFNDAGLSRDREGAGLGIAIARAIAEISGGRLAIDSRQSFGTTVAITLPLAEEEEARIRAA